MLCCVQLLRSYLIKLSMFKEVAYSNVLFTLLNVFFTLALPLLFLDNDFIALLTAQALAYQMACFT